MSNAPLSSLVDAAVAHLAGVAPNDRPFVLYLSVAADATSTAVAAQLRDALTTRLRVTFAQAALDAGPPLPGNASGEHVQSLQSTMTPWPDRVVRVSSNGNTATIAVRLTGRDPLGPAESGWEWFESRP